MTNILTTSHDQRYVRLFNRYRKELVQKRVPLVLAIKTAQHVAALYTKLQHEPVSAWPYLPQEPWASAQGKRDRREALRRRAVKNGAPRYV